MFLNHFLHDPIDVIGQPFIQMKGLKFELPLQFDWLFFSSSNAVKYFFEQVESLPNEVQFACIGPGTADALKKTGYIPQFIGSGPINEVADQFSACIGTKDRVLFPSAKASLRSVQKVLSDKQIIDLPVYETRTLHQKLTSYPDAIVFTSPSNVNGFVESGNSLEKVPLCIAIGASTLTALQKTGIQAHLSPVPSEEAMAKLTRRLVLS